MSVFRIVARVGIVVLALKIQASFDSVIDVLFKLCVRGIEAVPFQVRTFAQREKDSYDANGNIGVASILLKAKTISNNRTRATSRNSDATSGMCARVFSCATLGKLI